MQVGSDSLSAFPRSILSMDRGEALPLDMVEQLLKFTPSAEECALLEEHSEDADSLARADRFLYEISRYITLQTHLKQKCQWASILYVSHRSIAYFSWTFLLI